MKKDLNYIRLGIVDDDRLLIQLLKPLVERTDKIKVVLTANSGNEFMAQLDQHHQIVDVILLDLRMNNGSGLDVLDKIKTESIPIKVVVLSSYYQKKFIGQMLKKGANAFLPKIIDKEQLIFTIVDVYENGHSFSLEQMEILSMQLSSKLPRFQMNAETGLTDRELQILQLLCEQLNTGEIAKQLFISPKTVETHKSNLMSKTGVKNLAGLVLYALHYKIINLDELILLDC